MTAADVVSCARSWIGTPYVPGASLKGAGTDCVGMVMGVGRELGLLDHYEAPLYRETDAQMLDAELSKMLDPAPSLEEGDVVVFILGRRRHVGICTGPGLVHLHGRKYGVTEIPLSDKWRSRALSGWQFRGLHV